MVLIFANIHIFLYKASKSAEIYKIKCRKREKYIFKDKKRSPKSLDLEDLK